MIERLKSDAILYGAMYLLPDGTLIDCSNYKAGHAAIWEYVEKNIDNPAIKQKGAQAYLKDCGWIKFNTKVGYIETPREITKAQMSVLSRVKALYPNIQSSFEILGNESIKVDLDRFPKDKLKEWCIDVPFSLETMESVPFEKIRFFAYSDPGAMGIHGRLSLFLYDDGKLYEYCSTTVEYDKVSGWLETGLTEKMIFERLPNREEWTPYNMGCGNYLSVHKDVLEAYNALNCDRTHVDRYVDHWAIIATILAREEE